jgi:hypothetical protein
MKRQFRMARVYILVGFGSIAILGLRIMEFYQVIFLLIGLAAVLIGLELFLRNMEKIISDVSVLEKQMGEKIYSGDKPGST